jgi:hypothetical protein
LRNLILLKEDRPDGFRGGVADRKRQALQCALGNSGLPTWTDRRAASSSLAC